MTDENVLLAGELALGLLDGDERAVALRLVLADPAFAREVERWRTRFAALADEGSEIAVAPEVEARVMRAVDGPRPRPSGWRWVAALTGAAAAALLVVVLSRPVPPPAAAPPVVQRAPLLVAVLQPKDAEAIGAIYDPGDRGVRLSGPVAVPTGRDLELWAIGADGVPHAAGLVPRGGGHLIAGHAAPIAAGVTLALSVEPSGGSPKPTPTGPVIASGKLVAI